MNCKQKIIDKNENKKSIDAFFFQLMTIEIIAKSIVKLYKININMIKKKELNTLYK